WKSQLAAAAAAGEVLAESRQHVELLLQGTSDPLAEKSIRELVERKEWEELNDRFYKTMAFGTGGLRGRTIGKVVTEAEQGGGGPLDRPEF
ncbi:MAG: phospho-sugar mutase, partial [Akkermansiaceae bacterium]|nr:phospho-sugar mutase [Akkermansiaceae bacterium]